MQKSVNLFRSKVQKSVNLFRSAMWKSVKFSTPLDPILYQILKVDKKNK